MLRVGVGALATGSGHLTQTCCAIRAMAQRGINVELVLLAPATDDSWHRRELSKYVPSDRIICLNSKWIEIAANSMLTCPRHSLPAAMAHLTAFLLLQKESCFHSALLSKKMEQVSIWCTFSPFYINTETLWKNAKMLHVSYSFADDFDYAYSAAASALLPSIHRIRLQIPGTSNSRSYASSTGTYCQIPPLLDVSDLDDLIRHRKALMASSKSPINCLVYTTSYGSELQHVFLDHVAPRYENRGVRFLIVGSGWGRFAHKISLCNCIESLGCVPRAEFLRRLAEAHVFISTAGNESILEARIFGVRTYACAASKRSVEQEHNLERYIAVGYCERLTPSTDILARVQESTEFHPDIKLLSAVKSAGELFCDELMSISRLR